MNAVAGTPANARRVLRAILVMVCALGLLVGTSGSALAKTKTTKPKSTKTTKPKAKGKGKGRTVITNAPVTRGSTYLALGDSVTFGYEEPQVVPAPSYSDASSFLGYPELLGQELHLKVVNAACPGETTSSLIDATAQSNGCENAPPGRSGAYRTAYPLHVHYNGSQLQFAVNYLKKHHNVRLVSLMIGANDGFVCQETTPDHCTSVTELAAVGATISRNIKTILSAIRNKAHYGGQLVIVNYYSLNYASPTDDKNSALINQAVDAAASKFHTVVANGFATLRTAALHSGGDSCAAGLLTQLHNASTPCGIHPSYAGQSLLAQSLEKVIRLG